MMCKIISAPNLGNWVFFKPWLETVAVTVLGLSRKLGCLRSIFALSIAELRHPPSLEGAIAEIDGLMITRSWVDIGLRGFTLSVDLS
jgi:hypothetical protein